MNVSRALLIVGLGLSTSILAQAQLAAHSPFLPAPGSAAAAPAENSPIELRGILGRDQGTRFCIYDTVRRTSVWLGVNEKGYDFLIKSQDLAKETVMIEQGGRTFSLKLRDAKVATGPAAMPMPGPGAPAIAAGPNPVTQNVVLNPTAADEAKRLDDTVSEIQRRRALRDQASQAANGQVPAAPQNVTPSTSATAPAAQPGAAVNRAVR